MFENNRRRVDTKEQKWYFAGHSVGRFGVHPITQRKSGRHSSYGANDLIRMKSINVYCKQKQNQAKIFVLCLFAATIATVFVQMCLNCREVCVFDVPYFAL